MKVLHYIPSIDRSSGGTSTYIQLLAKELGRLAELYIVTHQENNPLTLKNCQINYISNSVLREMKSDWLRLLKTIQPDVVHVNCCWLPQCAFAQHWAQKAGYKVVLTPHGMLEPWIMKRHFWTRKLPALLLYQKRAVRNADRLHATAESERQNLLKLGYNNKIDIIANGIDVESIEVKQSWKRNKEILFLSRIHVKKGIKFLIEAVAALRDDFADYKINIVGEGDATYINELKQLSRQLKVEEQVHFTGGVYGEKKWKLFKKADIFVLPTYSENFGLVVAEALASGTPVLTTKGTPWQMLESNCCGWWTEVGTEPTIAALKAFLKLSEKELEVMGHNGRKLVETTFSAKKMAEDMVEMYRTLV